MAEIQNEFGVDSNKMFTILILLIFMDTQKYEIPDYFRNIPELHKYIDYIENSQLLKEIFSKN